MGSTLPELTGGASSSVERRRVLFIFGMKKQVCHDMNKKAKRHMRHVIGVSFLLLAVLGALPQAHASAASVQTLTAPPVVFTQAGLTITTLSIPFAPTDTVVTQTISISNTSATTQTIDASGGINGVDSNSFRLGSSTTSPCDLLNNTVLGPGQSCNVNIAWVTDPTNPALTSATAGWTVPYGSGSIFLQLTATQTIGGGVPTTPGGGVEFRLATTTVTSLTFNFGPTDIAVTQTLSIVNTGTTAATIDATGGISGIDSNNFRIGQSSTNPCSLTTNTVLPSGQICNVDIAIILDPTNPTTVSPVGVWSVPVAGTTALTLTLGGAILPPGAIITGKVLTGTTGTPMSGVPVEACMLNAAGQATGQCSDTPTDATGTYKLVALAAGTYIVQPGVNGEVIVDPYTVAVTGNNQYQHTFGVTPPVPPKPDVELVTVPAPVTVPGTTTGLVVPILHTTAGIPIVYWGNVLTIAVNHSGSCSNAISAIFSVTTTASSTPVRQGPMIEGPSHNGVYTGTITPTFVTDHTHGNAHMHVELECADHHIETDDFDFYIDPSGFVKDTSGNPVAGATVTLYQLNTTTNAFVQVPNGSLVMAPTNRTNPDVTDAVGHFQWDVSPGVYKVRAQKVGCTDPSNPANSFVETGSLSVPPAQTDLLLVLACATAPIVPTATPEASSGALLSSGFVVLGLAIIARRRRLARKRAR